MNKSTCKDCTKRALGCHSKCAKYAKWKKEVEKMREYEKYKNQQISDMINYTR